VPDIQVNRVKTVRIEQATAVEQYLRKKNVFKQDKTSGMINHTTVTDKPVPVCSERI
jgi:hypothetical protein